MQEVSRYPHIVLEPQPGVGGVMTLRRRILVAGVIGFGIPLIVALCSTRRHHATVLALSQEWSFVSHGDYASTFYLLACRSEWSGLLRLV